MEVLSHYTPRFIAQPINNSGVHTDASENRNWNGTQPPRESEALQAITSPTYSLFSEGTELLTPHYEL